MRSLTVGVVAEGATDHEMIDALVHHLIPGEHRLLVLQPEGSDTEGFGPRGAGWKGVVRWCQTIASDFGGVHRFMTSTAPALDLLLIHIDGDVAREAEIDCWMPCPQIQGTVDNIKGKIRGWLQEDDLPRKVILCTPCDNLEAWVLCAFDVETPYHQPPGELLECLEKPEYVISDPQYRRPRPLLKRKEKRPGQGKKPHKTRKVYRELIPTVLENWEAVKRICTQAQAFEDDVRKAIE